MSESERKWPSVVKLGVPGGFCAGVERSVAAYREFLEAHKNQQVYSVGEPAHNPHVNREFKDKNLIFVRSIDDVPDDAPVVFGPHGHTKTDEKKASLMVLNNPNLLETQSIGRDYMFTVCPLVTKVDNEIEKNTDEGFVTIYYGQLSNKLDKNGLRIPHAETRAAMASGNVRLITSREEAESYDLYDQIDNPEKVAFATQTTHNADEALEIGEKLKEIFPKLRLPSVEDTCYATRNRQLVAKSFDLEAIVIVGDMETSSNTRSLVDAARQKGIIVYPVNDSSDLKPELFEDIESVGIEASASAPKEQIDNVVKFFTSRGAELEELRVYSSKGKLIDESRTHFPPPKTHSAFVPQFVWSDSDRF